MKTAFVAVAAVALSITACGPAPECVTRCGATGANVQCAELQTAEVAFLAAFKPVWSAPTACAAIGRTNVFALPETGGGYLRFDPEIPTLTGLFYPNDGTVLIASVPLGCSALAHEWAHAVDDYATWENGGRNDGKHVTWTPRGINDAIARFPTYYAEVAP